MTIRLNGQTSGYVELEAPATAGSNTLVLPTGNGTSGQYLQTNGSGTLSWQTVTPAAFESYAVICDQKASGTNGGSFTSGDWRTRDLNTELADADGIVSISSNQFTLGAGTYLIKWTCPSLRVNANQSRLYNATTAAEVSVGQSNYADSTNAVQNISVGSARVDLSGNTAFEIQHRCASTFTGDGFGTATSFGVCIFTVVEIYKEA